MEKFVGKFNHYTVKLLLSITFLLTTSSIVSAQNYARDVREIHPMEKQAVMKAPSGNVTVDLVLFYQPIYARKMGGFEAVKARVDELVEQANAIHANSSTGVTLRVVELREITGIADDIPYMHGVDKSGRKYDRGTSSLVSARILNPDGYFDDEGVYQEQSIENIVYGEFGGDLVGYITDNRLVKSGRPIGNAGLFGEFFSMADTRSIHPADERSTDTLAHEIGHNFGANHEMGNAVDDASIQYNDIAHAYKCGSNYSVMYSASPAGSSFFSSPSKVIDGEACGIDGEADNRYVILQTKTSISERAVPQPSLGDVQFTQSAFSGSEESGIATITLERSGDTSQEASVLVQLVSTDAARSNAVMHETHKRAVFDAGSSTVSVDFAVIKDAIREDNQTLGVQLHYPYRLTVAGSDAELNIADDLDGNAGTIEFDFSPVVAGETATVTLNRVGGSDGELVVNMQSRRAAGVDTSRPLDIEFFELAAENIVFADGETQKTFEFDTYDTDTVSTPRQVLLRANVNGDYQQVENYLSVGAAGGGVTYTARASDAVAGDSVTVTLTRDGDVDKTLVVHATTVDGSLKAGTDYVAFNDDVIFAAGSNTASFSVNLTGTQAGQFSVTTDVDANVVVKVSAKASQGNGSGNGADNGGERSGGSAGGIIIGLLLLVFILRVIGAGFPKI